MNLSEKIRTVPHWPIEGVNFRDITTLLQDADAFTEVCDQLYDRYKDMQIDKVVGIDARGFIFAAVLAYKLKAGFVPVRKKESCPIKQLAWGTPLSMEKMP
jgi:adenine phosphoribosyltransferase (EC 2.4.2.7)